MIANLIAGLIGNGAVAVGDYESIQTVTVGAGGQASISFTSIPSGYSHLQIRLMALSSTATQGDLQFNTDTAANYAGHFLEGDETSATASAGATRSDIYSVVRLPAISGIVGASVIDILDYTSTNKNKTLRVLRGYDSNGAGNIGLGSGLWYASPSAITSIKITARSASFDQYSSFALYGVK